MIELEVRNMKANKTDHKLDTKPVQSEIAQTSTKKFKLKFTDFAVGNFTSTFGVPAKQRIYTSFDISKHTALKGLKLVQFNRTKKKYFVLRYWYQSQYYDWWCWSRRLVRFISWPRRILGRHGGNDSYCCSRSWNLLSRY